MARIGFKKGKFNTIDQETNKYSALVNSTVPKLEKVIDEKFAPEYNSAELYADDALAESDYSFKSGTLTITVANDDDTKEAKLMGNTITSGQTNAGEVTKNINDNAPEFGYGHIVTKMINGSKKYKVEFFPRCKCTNITTDAKTRGESIEFGTTTIEAKVFALETAMNGFAVGDWEKHKTFDTETAAETYLDTLLTPSAN